MNNLNGDERDYGLPKGLVSLRNPTVGAENRATTSLSLGLQTLFHGDCL